MIRAYPTCAWIKFHFVVSCSHFSTNFLGIWSLVEPKETHTLISFGRLSVTAVYTTRNSRIHYKKQQYTLQETVVHTTRNSRIHYEKQPYALQETVVCTTRHCRIHYKKQPYTLQETAVYTTRSRSLNLKTSGNNAVFK